MIEKLIFVIRVSLMLAWLLLSSLLVLPLGIFRWKNTDNNFIYGRLYAPVAQWIMGIRVEVQGLEKMTTSRPCIYVYNHQSGLDLMTFSGFYPKGTICIGKKEIRWIPIWGFIFEAFGNCLIDRKNHMSSVQSLSQVLKTVKEKELSVSIFPEGTRNGAGEGLLPFKKGAFRMAIDAQLPLVPVVSRSLSSLVNFRKSYAKSGTLRVAVLDPVMTHGRKVEDLEALMEEVRARMLKGLEELNQAR